MEPADVAIVGASAAGLAAAIAAARGGARVLLLEANREIGHPPAPAIVGFDFLWPSQLPRPPHAQRRRLEGARLRASDGRGPTLRAPLTLFDRSKLDAHLAAEAEKSGARIVTGARGDPDELRAKHDVVIFADGARTQAARYMRPTREPASLAWGAILEVEAPGDDHHLYLTLGPHAPGGRSQLNPLGEGRWSHWTFFRGDPTRAEDIARRALALDARIMGWDAPRARFAGVAADPVYTLPRELVHDHLLVAGGAAGQGGLEVGLASGWMAGEAAARREPRAYERAWKARYQKSYQRLRLASDALAALTDAETRALLGAWDGATLPLPLRAADLARRPAGVARGAWAAWLAWARA